MKVFEEDLNRIAQELKELKLKNKSFFITNQFQFEYRWF